LPVTNFILSHRAAPAGPVTLEQAVKRLTFESASLFGISDRGLLREGLAADIVIFDPDTVKPGPESAETFSNRRPDTRVGGLFHKWAGPSLERRTTT